MKNVKLRNQLDAIKLERTREVRLLKKEIENLEAKNKSQRKVHQGNFQRSILPYFDAVDWQSLKLCEYFFLYFARGTK